MQMELPPLLEQRLHVSIPWADFFRPRPTQTATQRTLKALWDQMQEEVLEPLASCPDDAFPETYKAALSRYREFRLCFFFANKGFAASKPETEGDDPSEMLAEIKDSAKVKRFFIGDKFTSFVASVERIVSSHAILFETLEQFGDEEVATRIQYGTWEIAEQTEVLLLSLIASGAGLISGFSAERKTFFLQGLASFSLQLEKLIHRVRRHVVNGISVVSHQYRGEPRKEEYHFSEPTPKNTPEESKEADEIEKDIYEAFSKARSIVNRSEW